MPELSITEYYLKLSRELSLNETPRLRGFFGATFADQVLLHHHREDGTYVYDYPRIQFKVLNSQAVLIGLEEGSELLIRLWLEVDQTKLGTEILSVQEATIQKRCAEVGECNEMITYRFLSPWLALNQENTRQYRTMQSGPDRRCLLESILIGNCLSFAKSFHHRVVVKLRADCSQLRPVNTRLKGIEMQGFLGTFQINFLLPDRVGIGKSVSRGFGTVLRVQNEDRRKGAHLS